MIRLAFFIIAVMIAIHFSAIELGLYSGKVWIDMPLRSFTVSDVISDMALGLLGGIIAAILYQTFSITRGVAH